MLDCEQLEARPIKRILCEVTGDVVGLLYQWNTGEISRYWQRTVSSAVVYRDIVMPGCYATVVSTP